MSKEVLERKAGDNEYYHPTFHTSICVGLNYLGEKFGRCEVEKYLRKVGREYFAPLTERIKKNGLSAVKEEFIRVYVNEEKCPDSVSFTEGENELTVNIHYCPGVRFMNSINASVSPYYPMTTSVVWDEAVKNTGISFEVLSYDEKTGASKLHFVKGESK